MVDTTERGVQLRQGPSGLEAVMSEQTRTPTPARFSALKGTMSTKGYPF
jgi:hypothetical protein